MAATSGDSSTGTRAVRDGVQRIRFARSERGPDRLERGESGANAEPQRQQAAGGGDQYRNCSSGGNAAQQLFAAIDAVGGGHAHAIFFQRETAPAFAVDRPGPVAGSGDAELPGTVGGARHDAAP